MVDFRQLTVIAADSVSKDLSSMMLTI